MRDIITAYDIANEIRMTRSQHAGCFLIVEGEVTDLRVYRRFVDSRSCHIVPAYGKENALAVLQILGNDAFAGVLAIVDADFWRLDGVKPESPNLFITDAHDLEAMMLNSPALDKLLAELGSPDKLEKFAQDRGGSLRQELLEIGRPLGYLRWISDRQNLSLKFEGIVFSRFVDRTTFTLDVTGMVRMVKNKSGRHDLEDKDLRSRIAQVMNPNHDPWDVCCGHDLICILSLGLRKVLGSKDAHEAKPELLEMVLRVAYEVTYFSGTQLFQSLRAWEADNQPFQIFPAT